MNEIAKQKSQYFVIRYISWYFLDIINIIFFIRYYLTNIIVFFIRALLLLDTETNTIIFKLFKIKLI